MSQSANGVGLNEEVAAARFDHLANGNQSALFARGRRQLRYLRRFGARLIVVSMASRILRSRSIALPKAS